MIQISGNVGNQMFSVIRVLIHILSGPSGSSTPEIMSVTSDTECFRAAELEVKYCVPEIF